METMIQDIKFGLRMLVKSPSLSIIATIAPAHGIGPNTAIFSVVNAVLLRPLPFPDSGKLVALFETAPQEGRVRGSHRSEEHTSELQSRGLISYAVFCLKKTNAGTGGLLSCVVWGSGRWEGSQVRE